MTEQNKPKKKKQMVDQQETTIVEEAKENDVDISPYVSNPEGDIYAISNLPEEFVATLFAWVSRSPKSFKEQLKKALKEFEIKAPENNTFAGLSKKAKDFHEKWTVGYGHSSVAEHAVAHVGIERISRLASAELELSNTYYGITEYSQRYQRPKRGDWFNPFSKKSKEYKAFEEYMNKCFDVFEQLIDGVYQDLFNKKTDNGNLALSQQEANALKKLAFEDARYVLPLAIYTQLGMTANGRAWRDGLAALGASQYEEVQRVASDIKKEISHVLPVLLKHAEASPYQISQEKYKTDSFDRPIAASTDLFSHVRLTHIDAEDFAIDKLIAMWSMEKENLSYSQGLSKAKSMSKEDKQAIVKKLLEGMGEHDYAPEAFKNIHYTAEFLISEASWHQLLRHNRKVNFVFNQPTPYFGYTIPPRIKEAGLGHLVEEIVALSKEFFDELMKKHPEYAPYVVLNAHKRRIVAQFSLWEAYHLINLRTSEEAQWDIKAAMEELYRQLFVLHPVLSSQMKRRK